MKYQIHCIRICIRIQIHIPNPPRVRLAKGRIWTRNRKSFNYYVIFLLILFFMNNRVPKPGSEPDVLTGALPRVPLQRHSSYKIGFFCQGSGSDIVFFECRIRSKNPIADLNYYIHKVMVLVLEYNTVGIRGTKSFFCNTSNAFLSSTFIQCLYYFQ